MTEPLQAHEKEIIKQSEISILTEAKLRFNPNQQLVTVKRKTGKYVDELWLKFLLKAEVIEGYKIRRDGNETEIEMTFAVEEK
jgi:hypothetical protein